MSRSPSRLLIVIFALSLFLPGVAAADAGFQLGVPNRNFPDEPAVNGMRVSFLWGKNERTKGFDLGLFSLSETTTQSGVALIGGIHRVTGNSEGALSLSLMNYHSGEDRGANLAFINILGDTPGAFNTGLIQIAEGETLFDLGGINVSKKSQFQVGFVNVTQEITGLQFGFLNMAENGFFKFFPIFNYPKKD